MGNIQYMDWGTIDWIFEPQEGSSDQMKVGISKMNVGSVQPRHLHIGDEQLMYVLQGVGKQKIEDKEFDLAPGTIFHISSGMSHESKNEGDEEIVKILVSIPAALHGWDRKNPVATRSIQNMYPTQRKEVLEAAVQNLHETMLKPLRMPISIYDIDGVILYNNGKYPAFCEECSKISQDPLNCPLYQEKLPYQESDLSNPSTIICKYGLALFILPIDNEGEILGFIKGGHVRTSEPSIKELPSNLPYYVPKSTVAGILDLMQKTKEGISYYYQFAQIESALENSERALCDRKDRELLLQNTLKIQQAQVTNLQINQHFLFNTLNMMLSTAIGEKAEQTYRAISSLSLMLQYTLRSDSYFVLLRDELNYVHHYLQLQKMRFKDRLHYEMSFSSDYEHIEVPFNFLQPIIENCFKHGFVNTEDQMILILTVTCQKNKLEFQITDNGKGMDADVLTLIRKRSTTGNESHGTSLITRKLDALYGDNYEYQVNSDMSGTRITIRIPYAEEDGL